MEGRFTVLFRSIFRSDSMRRVRFWEGEQRPDVVLTSDVRARR